MSQLFVGLIAEGTTDYRFLQPIIEKTLIDVAFKCHGQIDIEVKIIEAVKGDGFNDYVYNASQKGIVDYGITMLVVHADADSSSSNDTYCNKINPAKVLLEEQNEKLFCKNLIALIPVYETESWMLADKDLFRRTIGTKKDENELNISGHPESFNNPKERIIEAIRIGRVDMPKKMRENVKIVDLYSYMGEALNIEKLKQYESFLDFEMNIKNEFVRLNLLLPEFL